MHLRIFIVVSTVVLKNSSIDCVAKLSVEVDGNLIAHPENFPYNLFLTTQHLADVTHATHVEQIGRQNCKRFFSHLRSHQACPSVD